MKPTILLTALVLALSCDAAERIVCKITADAWVAMPPIEAPKASETGGAVNHGADPQLVIRGRESFALLQFDFSAARGLTIEKATLRLHRNPDPVPLHTVGISTISGGGSWAEGSVNFFYSRAGQQPWSYPGSDLVDVTFAQGGSLYAYPRAREAGDGWYEVDVPPAIASALATGDQFGIMLTDEKGQTQTRHVLSSREGPFPPVLIVEGARADRTPPGRVRSLKPDIENSPAEARRLGRTTLRPGSVILHFGGAGDDVGKGIATRYEVRYSESPVDGKNFAAAQPVPRWSLDPLAPKPHPLATSNALRDEVTAVVEQLKPGAVYYFASRARDAAGNAGPVSSLGRYRAYARTFPSLPGPTTHSPQPTTRILQPRVWAVPDLLKINPRDGSLLEQNDFPEHRLRNAVWDASISAVRLSAARNEFVAFQLAIESAQPLSGIQVSVARPLFAENRLPEVFRSTGAVQLYREWSVPDEKSSNQWYPDALVPLSGTFDLPARDNPVPGQTVQPVFVDIYVPHDAVPGLHTGRLLVQAGSQWTQELAVEVEVLPLRLPDKLNFIVDLNCYSGVRDSGSKYGTPEYRSLEQAYHRVAHLHRTNLDVLGYSHNGTTVPDHAPPLDGEGAQTTVASWKDWDAHFGPLLDGSAFADLPRAKVPVTDMYLSFFENWPGDLRRSYKFEHPPVITTDEQYREIMTRHALEAGPIEEMFSQAYQDRYSAVVRQFAEHFRSRGWTSTRYLVYFNDKYYYKRPQQGGRGISFWLFDEPNHRDDVRATAFLGYLMKKELGKYPDVPILLRTDISRVEWIRDLLAGQIDLNCISRRFLDKNRYLMDDRSRFGRSYWNYASTNHPRETNVSMRVWCWRVWTAGGDGLLPWNAVSGMQAWERAEPLTVFYPARKFGKTEPFASLRLKAYRRGQQDVEYLVLLASKKGWDREAVSRAIAGALDLSGDVLQKFEEDAGAISFRQVKNSDLDQLRSRVARALLEQ